MRLQTLLATLAAGTIVPTNAAHGLAGDYMFISTLSIGDPMSPMRRPHSIISSLGVVYPCRTGLASISANILPKLSALRWTKATTGWRRLERRWRTAGRAWSSRRMQPYVSDEHAFMVSAHIDRGSALRP
jgi:hypothetical protein